MPGAVTNVITSSDAVSSASVPAATHAPVVDDHDVVSEPLDFVELVGCQHDAGAARTQIFDHRAHQLARVRVNARGRLVEEDDVGVPDQGQRQRRALLLAPDNRRHGVFVTRPESPTRSRSSSGDAADG